MEMTFIPFTSVGLFKLDDDVENYTKILSKYFHTQTDECGDGYYHKSDKFDQNTHFLKVKNGKIRSIYCYESVIFNNVNLIGLTLNDFKKITQSNFMGEAYEMKDRDGKIKYIYDFDCLGLQIRTYQNKVIDIIVSGLWTYEQNPIKWNRGYAPFNIFPVFFPKRFAKTNGKTNDFNIEIACDNQVSQFMHTDQYQNGNNKRNKCLHIF